MTHSCQAAAFLVCGCFLLSLLPVGRACDNEYDRDSAPNAPHDSIWEFPGSAYVHKLRDKHQGEVISPAEKWETFQKTGDFRDEANYAVALMRTGEAAQAREIFLRLAKEHPDEYILAANLGTAYELTGENEQALTWIRKGMQLNPESHQGTEWLHVKILQAKIAAAADPKRFTNQSVLKLDFGSQPIPVTPGELERDDEGRPLTLESIRKALEYQLHERMFYVRPQDQVVASLLATLGNLLVLEGEREKAFHVFHLAGEYNPAGVQEFGPTLNAIDPYRRETGKTSPSATVKNEDPSFPSNRLAVLGAALAIGVLGGVVIWRRRRAFDSAD